MLFRPANHSAGSPPENHITSYVSVDFMGKFQLQTDELGDAHFPFNVRQILCDNNFI